MLGYSQRIVTHELIPFSIYLRKVVVVDMEVFKIVLLCLGACGLLAKKFHFEGERNFRELSHSNDKPRNLVQDIASCVAWVHQKR